MARTSRGRIFTRGTGTTYYCQWYLDGKQFVRALRDEDGKPITGKREARKAADLLLAPYALQDKAEVRRQAVAALRTAEDAAAEAEAAARPRLRLSEVWDRFPYTSNTRGSSERTLAPRTITGTRQQWEVFTAWAEGKGLRHVDDVTAEHAEAFRRELPETGRSADLTNRICVVARMMFRRAGVEPNPFATVRKLAHHQAGRRELSEVELRRVCGTATGELRTLFALGLYSGLRLKDAVLLDWSEVSADLAQIIRRPAKTAHTGREVVVPVHGVLAAILGEAPAGTRQGPIMPTLAATYSRDPSALTKQIGAHFDAVGVIRHKAGTGKTVDPKTGKTVDSGKRAVVEVGYHSLRHSFVTIAARQGTPLHVIQAIAGHASAAIQARYLHASNADARRAVDTMPDLVTAGTPKALPAPSEPERERLAALIHTAPLALVQEILAAFEKGGAR